MKIVIMGVLPTLNDYISAERTNKYIAAKIKKEATELVAWQVKGKPPVTKPVTIAFHWFYSTKHDFDNIRHGIKYLLDGMVEAGVLPDDSQKWVRGFDGDLFIKVPKGQEKVVLEITTID